MKHERHRCVRDRPAGHGLARLGRAVVRGAVNYAILERRSGHVIDSFPTEEEARDYVEREAECGDEWAIIEFGKLPTENRLVMTTEGGGTHTGFIPERTTKPRRW